jgi:hypothetical protein
MFIKFVLRVPLRMTDAACAIGDFAVHQEESYTFAYYNRNLLPRGGGGEKEPHDLESGVLAGHSPKGATGSAAHSSGGEAEINPIVKEKEQATKQD